MKAWLVLLGNSRLWRSLVTSLIVGLSFLLLTSTPYAQGMPITPSGLNTQVSDPIAVGGQTQYNITGGTRPGGEIGTNLFHSFGDFGVPPNNIANFLNGVSFDLNGNQLPAGLQTSNILARVTGTNGNNPTLSSIYGTIQTTGFGSANLFLMNPNGFLFGPNATVNVGGMATFTTADYMRLTDDGRFNANPNAIPADLLTAAPVAAFGFIGSNPHAIDFIGGQLTVAQGTAEGTGITLVGGDINLVPDLSDAPSSITAPGRQIRLTSVAGAGEVAADTGVPEPGMALGNITFGQGALLSTAGDPSFGDGSGSGGTVSIRGGQFVATGATINTSPSEGSFGSGGAVTVDVTGSASFTDSQIQTGPVIFSFAGSAGAMSVLANDSLIMTNTTIDTSTQFALGDSGAVTLTTNGPLSVTDSTINTRSDLSGNGGAVTVTGMDVTMDRTHIITDVLSDPGLGQDVIRPGAVTVTAQDTVTISGLDASDPIITAMAAATLVDAGSVTITGKTVNLSNGTVDVTMSNADFVISSGNGGAIEIRGNNVNLTQFQLISLADGLSESTGTGGSILLWGADSIHADNIQLTASQVNASATTGGGGGNIEFQSKLLTVSDHTDVATGSFGQGSGGTITVRGAENVTIESGSRVLTDVVISLVGVPQGTAGNILIETQNLTLQGGGHIRAGALPFSTGDAANITVQGTSSPAESVMIDGSGSGIFTNTEGTGAGGNVSVSANSVTLQNGGTISAATSGTAPTATGGSIAINATEHVTLTNSGSVTASSTGPGNTGNIQIDAGNQFAMTNSSVTTQATLASGGAIKITTAPSGTVQLTNSTISASVLDGTGGGGSVDIDPQYVILQNSQILARAVQGPGGNIIITITNGGLFLPDATSTVSASSQFGVNGTVTIQSPNAPASGKIQPLGKTPLQATSLFNQHCASLAGGEFSSFTVAGRDSLPTEPGSWLASPLALGQAGFSAGTVAKASAQTRVIDPAQETPLLSLRQIAPAGFLTQAFAVDRLTSCQS